MHIENTVLRAYKNVLDENDSEIIPDLSNKIGRDYGLDSLGFVQFIIEIEELLKISLDDLILDIRKCETLDEIVNILKIKTGESSHKIQKLTT